MQKSGGENVAWLNYANCEAVCVGEGGCGQAEVATRGPGPGQGSATEAVK